MTVSIDPVGLHTRQRRNVIVLALAQACLGAQMPMHFVIGGLAGQMLAPNVCLATLPISLIILGSMLSARPMATLMQRQGRMAGFMLGAAGGAIGALISATGLYLGSFAFLVAGSLISGLYMSAQGYYRFAAADTASEEYRPRAISYVMAGGLVAALIGTQMTKITSFALPIPFLASYGFIALLNLVGASLFLLLDIPRPPQAKDNPENTRSRMQLLRTPVIAVAILCATVTQSLMSLVMTSTPLAVVGCGYGEDAAADVVLGHVLAMFVPSFFTGHLILQFGPIRVIATGLAILAGAGAVALSGVELEKFYVALILLGVGWNFGFIGATALLANSHAPEERGRVQGMNELIVFGTVAMASFASGGMLNCTGGDVVQGWTTVNMAMAPLLMLAGGAIIWLVFQDKDSSNTLPTAKD